jgi:DNA repair exonuclease SbcCD ATPase subunit
MLDRVVDDDCAICYCHLSVGNSFRLVCGHHFHPMCLSQLTGNQKQCPLCRFANGFPSETLLRHSSYLEVQSLRDEVTETRAAGVALSNKEVQSLRSEVVKTRAVELELRKEVASLKAKLDWDKKFLSARSAQLRSRGDTLEAELQSCIAALETERARANHVQAENLFLRGEIDHMRDRELSFQPAFAAVDAIFSMLVGCTREIAALAYAAVDSNERLLIEIGHAESDRGLRFRRVVEQRDGLLELVDQLSGQIDSNTS